MASESECDLKNTLVNEQQLSYIADTHFANNWEMLGNYRLKHTIPVTL